MRLLVRNSKWYVPWYSNFFGSNFFVRKKETSHFQENLDFFVSLRVNIFCCCSSRYEHDPWLWSLDWSLHKTVEKDMVVEDAQNVSDIHHYIETTIQHLSEKRKKQLHLPGYPKLVFNFVVMI